MSIECWCLPVLFLGVCQINHGMVLLCSLQCVLLRVRSVLSFIFASGLFKKSGEKRKILDGLINISIHSFRLLCFFIFLNSLFPFGCCLSSLSLGSSCQRIWRTWGGGLLGCFNDLGAL